MLDLTKLPQRYLDSLGRERVAELIGVKSAMISMWISRKKFPLDAVQKLIEADPTPLHEITPFYAPIPTGQKLIILMPMNGPPVPEVMEAFARLYDPKEMDFERVAFNNLSVARNALAGHWLRGPWEWAIWWDSDTVPPFGDAPKYKRITECPKMPDVYAGVHAIYRMLVHKKFFVNACYVGRRKGAPPQFADGDGTIMRNLVARGPRNELMERDWSGFGFTLMNRKVLTDIIATEGESIKVTSAGLRQRFGYDYAFFTPMDINTPGDDLPFCARAIRAGHKPVIDLSVFAAHVGNHAYNYTDLV